MKNYFFTKGTFFMEGKRIMRVKQVDEYWRTEEHTIYKLARTGHVPYSKIDGQRRFKKDSKDKWIGEESLERET